MKNFGCLNQNKTKNPLDQWQLLQRCLAECSVVHGPMGTDFSWRERAGCMCAPHPSYDSSCGFVMCFLTCGWAGWSAGTSRTGPWVRSCLPGASRIINWNLFIWHSRGDHAILHEGYCLLSLLSDWLAWMLMCAVYCYIGHSCVFMRFWHYLFYIRSVIW